MRIFDVIPQTYPIQINTINIRLLPFVEHDFQLLSIDMGQERPKQIIMIVSKTLAVLLIANFLFSVLRFFFLLIFYIQNPPSDL